MAIANNPYVLGPAFAGTAGSGKVIQTQQYMSSKEVNLRIVECENGYMIFANNGNKSATRVATGDNILEQINACLMSLKME